MPYLTGQALTQADLAALFTSGTYTPTLGNMVIGTGGTPTNTAKYTFIGFPAGGVLHVEGRVKFGTTSVTLPAGSDETISLPSGYSMIEAVSGLSDVIGRVAYYDITGALIIHGSFQTASATTLYLRLPTIAGSYQQINVAVTATTPFAWAINDEIHYRFSARCTGP